MGICPRCGSWVDEGEPYCPECCYGGSDRTDKVNPVHDSDRIDVNGSDYDKGDGFVDEDELEEILEDM